MKAIYSMVDGNISEAIRGSTMDKVIAGSTYLSVSVPSSQMYCIVGSGTCRETIHANRFRRRWEAD